MVQTRKSVSLNAKIYAIARQEADVRGISLAQFVETAIRGEFEDALPETKHHSSESVRRARERTGR